MAKIDTCVWLHDDVCCNPDAAARADYPSGEMCERCDCYEETR